MSLLALDLGGTKLALALMDHSGMILHEERFSLQKKQAGEVGAMITDVVAGVLPEHDIEAIGICIPGIYRKERGTVWAPNIGGWDDYPLLDELQRVAGGVPVGIDSDRACYILGEHWKGAAAGCDHAIYIAVGTGIGAGVMVDGKVLRGAHDIAGATGWMALDRPFREAFVGCGCFESMASGEGIVKEADRVERSGLRVEGLGVPAWRTAREVFEAWEQGDPVAVQVVDNAIALWGMAVANFVSLFDPEKIIMGGGVFGPALQWLDRIKAEAARWAQPVSMGLVEVVPSVLGDKAGLYGAGLLARSARRMEEM